MATKIKVKHADDPYDVEEIRGLLRLWSTELERNAIDFGSTALPLRHSIAVKKIKRVSKELNALLEKTGDLADVQNI